MGSERRHEHVVTLRRADVREVNDRLWAEGVLPDFRAPDGIRLAPMSTSFAEVMDGILALAQHAGARIST